MHKISELEGNRTYSNWKTASKGLEEKERDSTGHYQEVRDIKLECQWTGLKYTSRKQLNFSKSDKVYKPTNPRITINTRQYKQENTKKNCVKTHLNQTPGNYL